MTFRFAWQCLIITVLALSTGACLDEETDDASAALTVSITNPDATEIDTVDTAIDVAGTASAATAIESISWQNDLGGSGTANGSESWQATNIPLELGSNTITVAATTVDGQTTTDSLVVNRESDSKGSLTISWSGPTQRTDGAPLTDLAGYRIYYGRMSETYDYQIEIKNPGVATYVIENLVPGDWYIAATAFDAAGAESEYSNEIVRTVL